ncbi:SNF1-interacting protein [Xylographa carneopallida]|nr:SNF1-interacting protein [Xylographa carneopallida]
MGNTSTKEQRPLSPSSRNSHVRSVSSPQIATQQPPSVSEQEEARSYVVYSSRQGRGSRSELSSLLGIGTGADRNGGGSESRRETKQDRDARKLEKERIVREQERERSMREESVDGGYLVTQGVYTGIEDYNKAIVRQLMVCITLESRVQYTDDKKIERRIAPFWRGLNDHSSSWTENQLVAAARALPIPAPDEIPSDEPQRPFSTNDTDTRTSNLNINSLTVPISSRSPSYNSDSSSNLSPTKPAFPLPSPSAASTLLRGRAKTLATLTTSSKNMPQTELVPREMNLPKDPFVNGQHIEAYLYKDASECPICFLYYPPYLNKTRCCDQAICSECFVQIKRPDPHPPEHVDSTAPPVPESENLQAEDLDPDASLVSEPAACPFCVQPEFGVTFDPPPFRRGMTYVNQIAGHSPAHATSAMSSSSSLGSFSGNGSFVPPSTMNRRRTTSISANSPTVITTDRVRPDWASKLSTARAHAARRSAAATALHTAAYLMGGRNGSPDTRSFGALGRRAMLRRGTGADSPSGGNSSTHLNMLALMAERYGVPATVRSDNESTGETSPTIFGIPRGSSRRNRVDDLEDMMLMEAIRLSLASEEERRKREEKDAKKEAKKKNKEDKKAEKAARKAGVYPSSSNQSTATLDSPQSGEFWSDNVKGKGVPPNHFGRSSVPELSSTLSRSAPLGSSMDDTAQSHLERSRAQIMPNDTLSASPYGNSNYKPSHLRTLSNVSSSASSIADSIAGIHNIGGSHSSFEPSPSVSGLNIPRAGLQETFISATPPGGGAGMEPMLNFRSLAAMIGNDENTEDLSQMGQRRCSDDEKVNNAKMKEYIPQGQCSEPLESNAAATSQQNSLGHHFSSRSETILEDNVHHGEVAPHQTGNQAHSGSSLASKEREIHVIHHESMHQETGSV